LHVAGRLQGVLHRTKDWADLEAMAGAWQLDVDAVGGFLTDLLGKEHPRLAACAS
jgi:hypothetical protein